MRENLFAYTPPGVAPPPYISINREEDGTISLTVRGDYHPAVFTENTVIAPRQDQATIVVSEDVAMDLVAALFNKLFFTKGSTL